jgi:hypothetical protein
MRHWFPRFIPLLAVVLVVCALLFLVELLAAAWPPAARCTGDECKEAREWIASIITVLVLVAGLYQYWRAQQWKRAEFVAGEMQSFFSLRDVRKAMLMIDWGRRNVNLLDIESTDPKAWPLVTRRLQSDALLPHPLRKKGSTVESEAVDSDLAGFSILEVAIRDAFDAFLDGLERFASHVESGLLAPPDLDPYLGYWIDDIARPTKDKLDGEWTCSLLAYIAYYRYTGVQALFREFDHDITPQGGLFAGFLQQVEDKERAKALYRLFRSAVPQSTEEVAIEERTR